MRKILMISTLILTGSALPWSVAHAVPPAVTATAVTSNTEKQSKLYWFNDAVGDILTGDHNARPSSPSSNPPQ